MPATHHVPELFEIEADSLKNQARENETYIIRMHLHGAYEVRSFLSDVGVDERQIAFAIAELGRFRQVKVKNEPRQR